MLNNNTKRIHRKFFFKDERLWKEVEKARGRLKKLVPMSLDDFLAFQRKQKRYELFKGVFENLILFARYSGNKEEIYTTSQIKSILLYVQRYHYIEYIDIVSLKHEVPVTYTIRRTKGTASIQVAVNAFLPHKILKEIIFVNPKHVFLTRMHPFTLEYYETGLLNKLVLGAF